MLCPWLASDEGGTISLTCYMYVCSSPVLEEQHSGVHFRSNAAIHSWSRVILLKSTVKLLVLGSKSTAAQNGQRPRLAQAEAVQGDETGKSAHRRYA